MTELSYAEAQAITRSYEANGVCTNCGHTFPCHNAADSPACTGNDDMTHECPLVVSMHFREEERNPGHVRVGVWVGTRPGSRAKAGTLTVRTDEWDELQPLLFAALDGRITTDPQDAFDKRRPPLTDPTD